MALKNWSLNTVTANTETDLVAPTANKEAAIVGCVLCNTSTTTASAVILKLTDSANTAKGTIWKGALLPGESVHLDTKIFLASSATPDKIRATADATTVSFIACGDES